MYMPRFLVPVDFSAISINAALYAVQMAECMPDKGVVLYNVVEEIHAGTDGTPIDFNGEALVASNLAALESLQVNLFEMGMSPMEIVAEIGELPERIKPAIVANNVDMVVMGITGTSTYDDRFLGKNALQISRNNTCPVMIVPPDAMFKGSGKVAVAINYKEVEKLVNFKPVKKWLDVLQPELHFIYVAEDGQTELTEDQLVEKAKVEQMVKDYKAKFIFITSRSFSDAINEYVDRNLIDQIIVFPKKHTFFESLFATHHSKKLVYHSHVPVLSIHE